MTRDTYRRWRVRMYRRLECWTLGTVDRFITVKGY